ncbi:MFS general substrate transporter [Lepidopterella palustris CBS 459.81]|uniref:MFS general substrate transporter n=1 Tax=Lepidopterella palustris CBS 459.81 TaxID=1314670 RepID=A0A8E2JE35_9PEZI|nr:MFS general substrate transporter [Lepidopterella palustris CBS 459.81]
MSEKTHRTTRIVSVVAATAISLACGTNYAYSAWAPQFADRLQLSATQSNIIGTAANIGMYASGIPMGMVVDKKGPRPAALVGTFALAAGYFPIRTAYENGPGSMSVALISFLSFLTGAGSCAAFQAALKTSALNWPHHRGTATAFPLAAFGLSAFFYTVLSGLAFPANTSSLLLLLSLGTSCLVFVSIPFLSVVDHNIRYAVLPTSEEQPGLPRRDSNQLHRTKSAGSKYSGSSLPEQEPIGDDSQIVDADENSSLMSGPGDIPAEDDARSHSTHHSHGLDITGLAMLPKIEFWQLWILLGLLTGVGLMTINNIGNDAQALWSHYDDTASKSFIAKRQLMHVSIISFMSFVGRLLSGVGSDVLVKKLHMSRFWCVAASALIFAFAQVCAIRVENPNHLWAVSGLSGLAYGALFGVFPALVVDAFGVHGFSVNWGFMTLAPVVSGNLFNLCYGAIYDRHSEVRPGGERTCPEGLECYRSAYWITLVSSLLGILVCLWGIRHEHVLKNKDVQEGHREA